MEEVRGSSPLVRTKTEDKGASKKRLTDRRFKIFMIPDKFL